jgi:hypothetical protein
MKKAIWFSRHQPSREQIEDAARIGYDINQSSCRWLG